MTLYLNHVAFSKMRLAQGCRRLLQPHFFRRALVGCSIPADPPVPLEGGERKESFRELYELPPVVIQNMERQGLIYPTEIQRKSLDVLLDMPSIDQKCTVINAETGSGKTLCFLLPILKLFEELSQKKGNIPAASAAVLVPSPHLAQQISDVFLSLAPPTWHSSVAAFHHTSFSFRKDSHLLIAIPAKLQNYNLEMLFAHNRLLCLDEADTLLSSRDAVTKDILKLVQTQKRGKKMPCSEESASIEGSVSDVPRVILTAATLPSKGPQTVGKQVLKMFPSVSVLKTENTHKILPMAELMFIPCDGMSSKLSQLVKDLYELGSPDSSQPSTGVMSEQLPKVLIFANTVKTATAVSNFLLKDKEKHTRTHDGIDTATEHAHSWWHGRVGSFFKQPGIFNEQRELILRNFRQGSLCVMVCSDLGSRGLDIPDCNAVIQFDFPENCEHFLHRAGRTARAGRSGTVISYVEESDMDVANEIQKVIKDRDSSFDRVFSRNKMLRRKINRRKKKHST